MNNLYDQIEPYLNGELSVAEKEAFEQAVSADASLATAVSRHRDMLQRLEGLRLRKTVKSAISGIPKRHGKSRLFTLLVSGSVLTALLLALVWFFLQRREQPPGAVETVVPQPATPIASQPETIPLDSTPQRQAPLRARESGAPGKMIALAKSNLIEPGPTMIRGNANTPPPPKEAPAAKAADQYAAGNFRNAADLLASEDLVGDDDDARYLRAAARFHLSQFTAAASDYAALQASLQYSHEARWNFILCQLALGNVEKAQKLLNNIIKEPHAPFGTRALELQNQLRNNGL